MKNSDEAIDKVLTGLRAIDAPSGMELRILRTMEQRAQAPSRRSAPAGWALASACAVAGIVAIAFYFKHPAIPAPAKLVAAGAPIGSPGAKLPARQRLAQTKLVPAGLPPRAPTTAALVPQSSWQAPEPDPATLDAAYAPSLLAPPLPLTEQERLLLRMTHLGDVVEVAMLTSAEWKNPADAEFDNFFAPPTVPIPAVPTVAGPIDNQPEATKVQGDTP